MSFLKKTCSIVLVAAVVLTMFACLAYGSVFAEGTPTLTIGDVTGKAGDTVGVDVTFAGNGADVNGLEFYVQYDNTKLTVGTPAYDLPEGVYLESNVEYDTNVIGVMLFSANPLADGTAVTLNFTIPTDVKGSEVFDITVESCIFSDGTAITGTTEDGSITAILYGDVDETGEVDASDLVTLKSYFANYDYQAHTSTTYINELAGNLDGTSELDASDLVWLKSYFANYDYTTHTSTVILGPQ